METTILSRSFPLSSVRSNGRRDFKYSPNNSPNISKFSFDQPEEKKKEFEVFRVNSKPLENTLTFFFSVPPSLRVRGEIYSISYRARRYWVFDLDDFLKTPGLILNPFEFTIEKTHSDLIQEFQISYPMIDSLFPDVYVRLTCTRPRIPAIRSDTKIYRLDEKTREKIQKCLSEDFSFLLNSGDGADVTIEVDGQELKVHRFVLKARSTYFAQMFSSRMIENKTGRVKIVGIGSEAFGVILKYLYAGTVAEGFDDYALEILPKVEEMMMMELKNICVDAMRKTISLERVCDFLCAAHIFKIEDLKRLCLNFVKKNAKSVTNTEGWKRLIKIPDLISEVFIFVIIS